MKRALSLYFPYLATDRLGSSVGGSVPDDASAGVPMVVTARQASVVRVVAADARALNAGVRPGMTLAEARALLPTLVTQAWGPETERAALESLAVVARLG